MSIVIFLDLKKKYLLPFAQYVILNKILIFILTTIILIHELIY